MTIEEHAITYKEHPTKDQLEYLITKANRLGTNGRTIKTIHIDNKENAKDLYFIVEDLKPKHNFCPY